MDSSALQSRGLKVPKKSKLKGFLFWCKNDSLKDTYTSVLQNIDSFYLGEDISIINVLSLTSLPIWNNDFYDIILHFSFLLDSKAVR